MAVGNVWMTQMAFAKTITKSFIFSLLCKLAYHNWCHKTSMLLTWNVLSKFTWILWSKWMSISNCQYFGWRWRRLWQQQKKQDSEFCEVYFFGYLDGCIESSWAWSMFSSLGGWNCWREESTTSEANALNQAWQYCLGTHSCCTSISAFHHEENAIED